MPAGVYRVKAIVNVAQPGTLKTNAPNTRLIDTEPEDDENHDAHRCLKVLVVEESTQLQYSLFEYTPWGNNRLPSPGETITLSRPIPLVHGLAPVKATDLLQ